MATLRQLVSYSATESPFNYAVVQRGAGAGGTWETDDRVFLGWNPAKYAKVGLVMGDGNEATLNIIARYRDAFSESALNDAGLQRFSIQNYTIVDGDVGSTLTVTLRAGEFLWASGFGFRGNWAAYGSIRTYIDRRGIADPPLLSPVPVKVLISQENPDGSTQSVSIPILANRGLSVELADYTIDASERSRGYDDMDTDRGYDNALPYAEGYDRDGVAWKVEFAVNGEGRYAVVVDGGIIAFGLTAEQADVLAQEQVALLRDRKREEEQRTLPDEIKSSLGWVVVAVVGVILLSSAARGFGQGLGGAVGGA